jgi:predicted phosphodiesterase
MARKKQLSTRNEKQIKKVVDAVRETAETLDIDPRLVTKGKILKNTRLTEWDVRSIGSLKTLIDDHFPTTTKALGAISEMKDTKKYITKLEKMIGEKEYFFESVERAILKQVEPVHVKPYKFNNYKDKNPIRREMVGVINDCHYGLTVDPEEVKCNSYGWQEACRRTAFFTKELAEYKPSVRDQVEKLHLILNGDIISGFIHNFTGRDNELCALQMNGALHILTHSLARLLENFREIDVYGIPGNHEDFPHRREGGGRVMSQRYDSWANILYYALSVAFKDCDRIRFHFPKTPYVMVDTIGGRIMAVHGDTVFSAQIGNPGNTLNIKSLSDAINRFNGGEINQGNAPLKMVIIGHTHVEVSFTTFDGIKVYNAPSLSGIDAYATNLSINSNLVGQILFEVTERDVFGDSRLIKVNRGDNLTELDKIIPIYRRTLRWDK